MIRSVDVLARIRHLELTIPSFDDKLIGWLCSSAPEIIDAVLDKMVNYYELHAVES